MINPDAWMQELTEKLKRAFGRNLLFVGLQGSYRRGEAHESSDIDAVVVLDELSIDILAAYRELIRTMPEDEKACGFLCGRRELASWPKHELFQFERDTRAYFGSLHELLPELSRADLAESVKIGASGLYHACCHTAVFDPENIVALAGMFKSAGFLLQAVVYLRTGFYAETRNELLARLSGDEREILLASMNCVDSAEQLRADTDTAFALLLRWTSSLLVTDFSVPPKVPSL